jgi:hypothetical protein
MSTPDLEKVAHPAWLWRSSRWFDPTASARGPIPSSLPLRAQLDPASRLAGSPARTSALLAATVATLRKKAGPVAITIDPKEVADPAPSGRWFLLAVLTCLPVSLRLGLRISTFEDQPDPALWDVVVVSRPATGFQTVRPEDNPPLGGDLPASFLLDHLRADDPETVEEVARESANPERWLEEIRLRRPKAEAVGAAPRGTARGTAGGSPARTEAPRRLLLNTPEAWLSLSHRDDDDRAKVVKAWLDRPDAPAPSEGILDAVAQIRPPGRDTERWCAALLRWAAAGPSRTAAVRRLAATLDSEPLPLEPAVRASLWTEYMHALLDLGLYGDAVAAFSAPSATLLLEAGAARVLTEAWVRVPASRRPEGALKELVDKLIVGPKGGVVVAHLWQALMVEDRDARADIVLQEVARRVSLDETIKVDALLDVLADSPQAMRWVGHVARIAPPDRLWALVAPVTSGPEDPLWEHCVDVRSQSASPEDRIADLVGLPEPQILRLERELRRTAGTVRVWRFPDGSVAEGASRLAMLVERSPLWLWLYLCASPAGSIADARTSNLVDAFCADPPASSDERRAAVSMAEALGAGEGWTPLAHASLLLRLTLAPDGDGSSFALDLSAALARGAARRPEGARHLADITDELGVLPPDHPAIITFVTKLLPAAFARGIPPAYVGSVHVSRWPMPTRDAWRRVVETLGGLR